MTTSAVSSTGDHQTWLRLAQLDADALGPREEDVKFKFVASLLRVLGFEDTDCTFETPADLGRIDISISRYRAAVIFECKAPHVRLEGYISQLEKYVRETMTRQHEAMIAVLTNGERILIFGVLEAIHKNELAEHFLLEVSRPQLAEQATQARLMKLIGREAVDSGDVRSTVETMLRDHRVAQQQREEDNKKRRELVAEKNALTARFNELESELAQLSRSESSKHLTTMPASDTHAGESRFQWSREFGSTEVVCGWLIEVLEELLPSGSSNTVSHAELTAKLCALLDGRGTERAIALLPVERLRFAGNMVDWITARWTAALGGKDSDQMQLNPGAEVTDPKSKPWIREFTHVWTREKKNTWAFRRR
jgi:hypothetical protein